MGHLNLTNMPSDICCGQKRLKRVLRNPDCQRPQPYDKAIPVDVCVADTFGSRTGGGVHNPQILGFLMEPIATHDLEGLWGLWGLWGGTTIGHHVPGTHPEISCVEVLIDYTGWTPGGKMQLALRDQLWYSSQVRSGQVWWFHQLDFRMEPVAKSVRDPNALQTGDPMETGHCWWTSQWSAKD